MISKKKGVIIFISIIFFGIIGFALREPRIIINKSFKQKPDFYFENLKLTEIEKGQKTLIIHAKSAEINKKTNNTILKTASAEFRTNDQQVLSLIAPMAELIPKESRLCLEKPQATIYLESAKTIRFSSDQLNWYFITQKFIGQKNVKIQSEQTTLHGDLLVFSIPFRTMQIKGQAGAGIHLSPK